MRLTIAFAFVCAGLLPAQTPSAQASPTDLDFRTWVNRGVQAFRAGRIDDAIEDFQHAVEMKPDDPNGHLYLATAYMQAYIPGARPPENLACAAHAEAEFRRVLDLDHSNPIALASLGSLSYNRATSEQGDAKLALLEQARDWNRQLLAVDPGNKEPHYWLGVLAWAEFYPALMQARAAARMKPEDPGPISNAASRRQLARRYTPLIEDGMSHLRKAIEIDPANIDATTYLNLLIRERADLRETKAEYNRDVADADGWVGKALEVKKARAAREVFRAHDRRLRCGGHASSRPAADSRQRRRTGQETISQALSGVFAACNRGANSRRREADLNRCAGRHDSKHPGGQRASAAGSRSPRSAQAVAVCSHAAGWRTS